MIHKIMTLILIMSLLSCVSYQAIPNNDILYAHQSYRIKVNGKKKSIQPMQESQYDQPLTYLDSKGNLVTIEREQLQSVEQKAQSGGGAKSAYIVLSIVSLVLGTVVSILQITR